MIKLLNSKQIIFKNLHLCQFSLQNQRARCFYPDVQVKVEEKVFPSHRFILAACSHFFRGLFASDMKECSSDVVDLNFPSITAEIFEKIHDFVYSGRVEINEENVNDLWHSANQLQLDALEQECGLFQERRLNKDNCVYIYNNAKALESKKLLGLSWEMICNEFDYLKKTDHLLYLATEDMQRLVGIDKLTVASEDQIVDVIYSWLLAKKSDRMKEIDKVLASSRISHATSACLMKLVGDGGIQGNANAVDIIQEAFAYKLQEANRHSYCPKTSVHRETSDQANVLVTLPVEAGQTTMSARRMNGAWFTCTTPDAAFDKCSTVSFGDFIFAISWTEGKVPMKFSTQTNQWSALPNLNKPGGSYLLVAEGEYVYAVGGADNNNIERINVLNENKNPGNEQWENFAQLERPVTHMAVLSTKNSSIVVFGRNKNNPEESVVQIVDLRAKNCSVFLDDAPGLSESSVCFKTRKNSFYLQQDGSLWRVVDDDASKIKMEYISNLWDVELELHGATVCNGELVVTATVKDSPWKKQRWETKENVFFSGVTVINRGCNGLVNAVMPKALLNNADPTFAEC